MKLKKSVPIKKPNLPKFKLPKITADKMPFLKTALLVLVSLTAGFFGGMVGSRGQNNVFSSANQSMSQQIISSESQLFSEIAKSVGPSVVSINVTTTTTRGGNSFFGFSAPAQQQSAGTGFILNTDGVVITNRHVVTSDNASISITLSDGTQLDDVEVLGRTNDGDPLDIAFLKINDRKGKDLVPAKIGDSSKMQVGDKVVAIGNALGQFQNTVTSGIISGYGRQVEASDGSSFETETLQNLFQTDAAINQGNSGGPLVNMSGEVIAINTAVAGGDAESIGFAIPINDVKGLINSVQKEGKLQRPYLGVRYILLTDDLAYMYNLETKRGAYIAPTENGQESVISDSPAAKAGLKEKDIIISVNSDKIDENNSLVSVLGRYNVGDEVELTIVRDKKEQKIKVRLEAAP